MYQQMAKECEYMPMCRAQLDIHSSSILERQPDASSYRLFLLISGLLASAAE